MQMSPRKKWKGRENSQHFSMETWRTGEVLGVPRSWRGRTTLVGSVHRHMAGLSAGARVTAPRRCSPEPTGVGGAEAALVMQEGVAGVTRIPEGSSEGLGLVPLPAQRMCKGLFYTGATLGTKLIATFSWP